MKIYAVELGGNEDPHLVEYGDPTDRSGLESLLYVSVPQHISLEDLDPELKAVHSKWLRAGQMAIFRLHQPLADELLREEFAIHTLRHRLEGLPVFVAHLQPDRSIGLTQVVDEFKAPPHDPEQLLEAVRFAELHSWLERPGVVLPANDDFHYEGPNGYRYESFMRVGTAIQGIETLEAISFWLQPHLRGNPLVVLDAWTINSVALNLSRYADRCGAPCEPAADIECLGAYDEDLEKLRQRLEARLESMDPEIPALLISSVVSQGNLHRALEAKIKDVGFQEVRSLALYGSADFTGTAFCCPAEVGRYFREDDPECPTSPTVAIQPATYLVEVAIKPNKAKISEVQAKQAWDFFDHYGGGDFLRVHRDEPGGERHHMIHVDVKNLMGHPRFSKRLDEELESLQTAPPDVVLAPTHAAALALGEEVSQRLGVELIPAAEKALPHISEPRKEKLRRAEDILIVDDVVTTGARLLGYRNFLRRCEYITESQPSRVHLLAGLARVPNNRIIVGIEEMADRRERFHQVETLVLPDWGRSECPWCWELRQLEATSGAIPLTEKLEKRWDALRKVKSGLEQSLYLPWMAEGSDPLPVSVWKLGPGSVFHAKSEIDLFVAVAAAIQSMRAGGLLMERPMFPVGYVLDPASWLTGRYYDSVIAAAILRATRRHDIRATEIEPELLQGIADRVGNGDDLRGEMLMAMARRQLPVHPDAADPEGLLADPAADAGVAALLRSTLG